MHLVQKSLVRQNVTTGRFMYKCIERLLKSDVEAVFLQQLNSVGRRRDANFTMIMATTIVHLFPNYCHMLR